MPSLNQAETVKQLLLQGWTVTPSTTSVIGGPVALTRPKPDGTNDQVTVPPDGEVKPNAGP